MMQKSQVDRMQTLHQKMVDSHNYRYGFGEKFEDISQVSQVAQPVDCSGYHRWLIYHASAATRVLPDGSINQRDYYRSRHFPRVPYSVARADRTGSLYACGFEPKAKRAGHIWFMRDGRTMESCGGVGVTSRSAATLVLRLRCTYCFKLS